MNKIKAGIIGATGIVGQRLVSMLSNHPWFQVSALTASDSSAGRSYGEACSWKLPEPMPETAEGIAVDYSRPGIDCRVVFSAVSGPAAYDIEDVFARNGYIVVSNASAHRTDSDVPLIIPEVNPEHLKLIERQKKSRGFENGFIVTNPNCSAIPLAIVLSPMAKKWGVSEVYVTTLQAVSGAGYPGVASLDIYDNIIPFIKNEEEKIENETKKLLGSCENGFITPFNAEISTQVHRVPVSDGHLLSVALKLEKEAEVYDIKKCLRNFTGLPQLMSLPNAPNYPIIVRDEEDRPQPRLDRSAGNGMSVVVGRIRRSSNGTVRMSILGHNTIRGAAGAAVLNAELLKAEGYISPNYHI